MLSIVFFPENHGYQVVDCDGLDNLFDGFFLSGLMENKVVETDVGCQDQKNGRRPKELFSLADHSEPKQ